MLALCWHSASLMPAQRSLTAGSGLAQDWPRRAPDRAAELAPGDSERDTSRQVITSGGDMATTHPHGNGAEGPMRWKPETDERADQVN